MPHIERQGAVTVVRPDGPLRHDSVSVLQEQVTRQLTVGVPMVVVDLSETPLIDSAGLEWLLDLDQKCCRLGGCIRLCSAGELCHDILRITGVSETIQQFNNLTAALGSFA